jgi:hypothetical protein
VLPDTLAWFSDMYYIHKPVSITFLETCQCLQGHLEYMHTSLSSERSSSSGRAPALQMQSPEFKLQPHQKKEIRKSGRNPTIVNQSKHHVAYIFYINGLVFWNLLF